ncbi:hypothetical protein PAXRUDRAFT_11497 [Paxillus rubicundulus Ve08.2h10]|uniref:Uncharacterized protein n=1 Tax=Paxillus rubicundulus Ve08.2h10 TaxID=930991 RepID=A0A0D0E3B7_9AGAM|nr:hypothetical protein PAXRUDRAFT_11497 [Paxillus rubicundulus Ve08.2h10]
MTQDIRFNSFGIPYVVEFENVSFVPQHRIHDSRSKHPYNDPSVSSFSEPGLPYFTTPSPSSSTSSFCHIESPPPAPRFPSLHRSFSLRSASSLFRLKPRGSSSHLSSTRPIPSQSLNVSSNVLPTWSAPEHTKPLPPTPHLKFSDGQSDGLYIQFASPQNPSHMGRKDKLVHLQKTINTAVLDAGMNSPPQNTDSQEPSNGEKPSQKNRGYRTHGALYCGTYGQMMAALEGAGLYATPCMEAGLSGSTRLGALFVARHNGASGIELRKITLWG